jgi:hypothetical protein
MRKIITAAAVAVVAGSVQAAVISWNVAQITGDSAVSTSGTGVEAYNFGAAGVANQTINGVTFAAAADLGANQSVGQYGSLMDWSRPGNRWGIDSGLSGSMSNMLAWTWADDANGTAGFDETTITLSGLTSGQQYEVQLFAANANATSGSATVDFGTAAAVTLGISTNTGGPAVFTGTFTADATSQAFDYRVHNGSGGIIEQNISGYQLRVIPEPATIGLIAFTGGGLILIRRRFMI